MKFNVSIYKFLIIVIVVGCIGVFISAFFLSDKTKKLNTHFECEIELIKAEKDSIIEQNINKIKTLRERLTDIDYVLAEYESKLDSLNLTKQKIKIIYKYKYQEIKQLSDTAIEKYWRDKFNNE